MKVKKWFEKFGISFDKYAIEHGKYPNGNNMITEVKTMEDHFRHTLSEIMDRHVDFVSIEGDGDGAYLLIYTKQEKGDRPL